MNRTAATFVLTTIPALGLIGLALAQPGEPAPVSPATPPLPAPEVVTVATAGDGSIVASAEVDRSAVLQEDGTVRVKVTVRSTHASTDTTSVPTDLVVVLDRSGSMSGEKIEDAKEAAAELLGQLRAQDRFSLVTYASESRQLIPMAPVTDANARIWAQQIRRIGVGGGTEMQSGLATGQASLSPLPGRAQRMILISDGLPNSAEGLLSQASSLARAEVPLTTVGIGMDYDEQLMAGLADAGTGNFYWVQGSHDMAETFAAEFDTARETVASGMAVRFQPGSGATLVEAAGYSHRPEDGGQVFDVGTMFAQQERSFWLTLDVGAAEAGDTVDPGELVVRWQDLSGAPSAATIDLPALSVTDDAVAYHAGFSSELWGEGIVEEEYNRMRAQVSARVQSGDRDGALALIDAYYTDNFVLNSSLGNAAVSGNLSEVQDLRGEVVDNFTGDNQRERQNSWAKSSTRDAYVGRRGGQYKK